MNEPVDCPAVMVTLGNVAASSTSELVSVTTVPPAGAAPLSVTVQLAESPLPPAITDGLHVNEFAVCACAVALKAATRARSASAAPPSRVVESVNRNLLSVALGEPRGGGRPGVVQTRGLPMKGIWRNRALFVIVARCCRYKIT